MISTAYAATAASAASAATPVMVTAAEAGFLAGVAGFIAGWAVVILAVLFLFGVLSEHNESSGWAVFWALLLGAVAFVAFDVPLMFLAIGAGVYAVVGLLWSFYRYKRHVQKQVDLNRTADAHQRERVLRKLHPSEMIGTITAWILVWPMSLVGNLVGDLINFAQLMVTKFFRGVYYRIYDAAVAALK